MEFAVGRLLRSTNTTKRRCAYGTISGSMTPRVSTSLWVDRRHLHTFATDRKKINLALHQKDEQESHHPIFRAIVFAKDRFKKGNEHWVFGFIFLLRRHGEDRNLGGIFESWLPMDLYFIQGVSLIGHCDSFVSDGEFKQYTAPCTFHTRKHFLARGSSVYVASFSVLFLKTIIFTSGCHFSLFLIPAFFSAIPSSPISSSFLLPSQWHGSSRQRQVRMSFARQIRFSWARNVFLFFNSARGNATRWVLRQSGQHGRNPEGSDVRTIWN